MAAAAAAAASAEDGPVDVLELMTHVRDSAAVLDTLLQGASNGGICRVLVAEIFRCCDRVLAALHDNAVDVTEAAGRKRKVVKDAGGEVSQARPKRRGRGSGGGETPARVEKKATAEDGFMWRKYGQKEIQNSNYPRLYFRCTYKHDSGCPATKQVQRWEDDPSLYAITYFGEHTCCGDAAAAAAIAGGEAGSTVQSFVINFESSSVTANSGSPWFPPPSEDDTPNETSRSPPAVRPPVEDDKLTKLESTTTTPDWQPPAAELSSPADVFCISPALDDLLPIWWDDFVESSLDNITDLLDSDEIDRMLLQH